MSKPSVQDAPTFYENNSYIIAGILLLCLAMLCFGVGVFIDSPTSAWGITFASLGLVLELLMNACFLCYAYLSRKNRK